MVGGGGGGGDAGIVQQGQVRQPQLGRRSRCFPCCTSLFSYYETAKYVHIEDSRLGLLRLVLLLGIVSYVVIIEMIQMGGYLESNPIVGVVLFSLQQPTMNNCDPSQRSCKNAFVPLNESRYCKQYHHDQQHQLQQRQRQRQRPRSIQSNTTTTNYNSISSNNILDTKKSEISNDNNQSFNILLSNGYTSDDDENSDLLVFDDHSDSLTSSTYPGKVLPCQIYEAVNAQIIRETSIVIWTRATTYNQTLVCDGSIESGSMVCSRTYENNNNIINSNDYDIDDDPVHEREEEEEKEDADDQPFYIAQSEAFTVLLQHAVTASRICESHQKKHRKQINNNKQQQQHYSCSAQASQYEGRLYSINDKLCYHEYHINNNSYTEPTGNKLQQTSPCYIGPNRTTSKQQDFFSLDVLLQASGVSLDDCISDDEHNNHNNHHGTTTGSKRRMEDNNDNPCTTYRESGATLLLDVVWNDFQPYRGVTEPYYYYSPQLIGTSYKESIPFYEKYRNTRILFRGHGIKIAVLLGGNFHRFQFLKFLVTLTTALGLLAVATTVVDSLMLYVLPEKDKYQQIKYEYETIINGDGGNNNNNIDGGGRHNITTDLSEQRRQQQSDDTEEANNDETSHCLDWIRQRMFAPSGRGHRHYRQVLPSQTNTNTDGQTTVEMLETTTTAAAATQSYHQQQQQQQADFVGNDISNGMTSSGNNNLVITQSSDENLREPLLG